MSKDLNLEWFFILEFESEVAFCNWIELKVVLQVRSWRKSIGEEVAVREDDDNICTAWGPAFSVKYHLLITKWLVIASRNSEFGHCSSHWYPEIKIFILNSKS